MGAAPHFVSPSPPVPFRLNVDLASPSLHSTQPYSVPRRQLLGCSNFWLPTGPLLVAHPQPLFSRCPAPPQTSPGRTASNPPSQTSSRKRPTAENGRIQATGLPGQRALYLRKLQATVLVGSHPPLLTLKEVCPQGSAKGQRHRGAPSCAVTEAIGVGLWVTLGPGERCPAFASAHHDPRPEGTLPCLIDEVIMAPDGCPNGHKLGSGRDKIGILSWSLQPLS